MATFFETNAVVVTRVHCISNLWKENCKQVVSIWNDVNTERVLFEVCPLDSKSRPKWGMLFFSEISISFAYCLYLYTQQNNSRATSFIFHLIIIKMRPSDFKIVSWAKLEVSALFQSPKCVRNMFSYKSVNGTNNTRPTDSKKNENFKKKKNMIFTSKWTFSTIPENFFV